MKAIVTGCSRGLGAAIADNLLARGVSVLGIARQPNTALAAGFGDQFTAVSIDLADTQTLTEWIRGHTLSRFLSGDEACLLINSAGTVQPIGPLGGQSAAVVAQAVSLNVAAPLMLADAFVAVTPSTGDRRILHVSSGAARKAYAGWAVYCATKAALDHHARAVAEDAVSGVRIGSVAPGVVDTDMQGELRSSRAADFPARGRFEALKRDGALLSPDECAAQLMDYLLSDAFGASTVVDLRELPADGNQ